MNFMPIAIGCGVVLAATAAVYLQLGGNAAQTPHQVMSHQPDTTASGSDSSDWPAKPDPDFNDPSDAGPGPGAGASRANSPAIEPEVANDYQKMLSIYPDSDVSLEEYAALSRQREAWQPVDQPPAELDLPADAIGDGRHFLKLNQRRLGTLVPGDRVDIEIPQALEQHTLVVDQIRQHGDGNRSVIATLEGLSSKYSASITQGNGTTVMGVTTPSGHYTMEAKGNDGWVLATGTNVEHPPEDVYSEFVVPANHSSPAPASNSAPGGQL